MQKKRQSPQIMHQSIAPLILPEYRRRILGLLLLRPEAALHGREIARRTGLPAGSVARELRRLASAGLLDCEKRGNQQVYRANTGAPIFAELASILRKTSGLVDVLADALAPLAAKLQVAFVFGSVAQGRESTGSDVDVMLVGDVSFRQAVELLHPVQATIGREVNPNVFAIDEFSGKLRTEPFLGDVMAKPKLFIIGNAHDLEELARHQP